MEPPLEAQTKAGSRACFIPIDLDRLIGDVVARAADAEPLRRVLARFVALHRAGLQSRLDELDGVYRAFDPDRETLGVEGAPAGDVGAVVDATRALLRGANFVEVGRDELDRALQRTSPLGLAVSVDLSDFEVFGFHRRGVDVRTESRRDWRRLGLRRVAYDVRVDRRVFVYLKVRAGAGDPGVRSDGVHLRLFKDVPRADLEMLLPNTRVRMRAFDRWKLGITGGGGTVGGIAATVTKVGAAASPTTWALALAGLAAVLWRQLHRVLVQRTKYSARLASRLYFHTLANNRGALGRLAELAASQDAREAVLAYAFLLEPCDGGWTAESLDRAVEGFLSETYGMAVDFEVRDGLDRLAEVGLVTDDAGRLTALDPESAARRLAERWAALV